MIFQQCTIKQCSQLEAHLAHMALQCHRSGREDHGSRVLQSCVYCKELLRSESLETSVAGEYCFRIHAFSMGHTMPSCINERPLPRNTIVPYITLYSTF